MSPASLVAQSVKNPPAMQDTWIRSLCWEDPLEEGMATHSSVLAQRIPWTEEPGRLQPMGSQRVDTAELLSTALGRVTVFNLLMQSICAIERKITFFPQIYLTCYPFYFIHLLCNRNLELY